MNDLDETTFYPSRSLTKPKDTPAQVMRWITMRYLRESAIQQRLLTLGLKLNKVYRAARSWKG